MKAKEEWRYKTSRALELGYIRARRKEVCRHMVPTPPDAKDVLKTSCLGDLVGCFLPDDCSDLSTDPVGYPLL